MIKLKLVLVLISLFWLRIIFLPPTSLIFFTPGPSAITSIVIKTYQSVLPKRDADLLSGVVLGSSGLSRSFKTELATVGLTHVVAASGMNVSLFIAGALSLLALFKIPKNLKFLLILVLIVFYSTLTGFAPPIVRASLMAGILVIATILGRKVNGWYLLTMTAYLMLWVTPDLVTNPSFLLSFTSTMGQIFLSTIKLNLPKFTNLIAQLFLQSLVALVFTLPIVLIFFSSFSLIAIFTNAIVLWTVEPLMLLGGLIASLGIFFTPFAQALALPAQGLLEFFLLVVDTFGKLSFAKVNFSFSSSLTAGMFAVGYYLLLTSVVLYRQLNLAMRDSKS